MSHSSSISSGDPRDIRRAQRIFPSRVSTHYDYPILSAVNVSSSTSSSQGNSKSQALSWVLHTARGSDLLYSSRVFGSHAHIGGYTSKISFELNSDPSTTKWSSFRDVKREDYLTDVENVADEVPGVDEFPDRFNNDPANNVEVDSSIDSNSTAASTHNFKTFTLDDRIYCVYGCGKSDRGAFGLKWSDDGGRTFKRGRVRIPVRRTAIDLLVEHSRNLKDGNTNDKNYLGADLVLRDRPQVLIGVDASSSSTPGSDGKSEESLEQVIEGVRNRRGSTRLSTTKPTNTNNSKSREREKTGGSFSGVMLFAFQKGRKLTVDRRGEEDSNTSKPNTDHYAAEIFLIRSPNFVRQHRMAMNLKNDKLLDDLVWETLPSKPDLDADNQNANNHMLNKNNNNSNKKNNKLGTTITVPTSSTATRPLELSQPDIGLQTQRAFFVGSDPRLLHLYENHLMLMWRTELGIFDTAISSDLGNSWKHNGTPQALCYDWTGFSNAYDKHMMNVWNLVDFIANKMTENAKKKIQESKPDKASITDANSSVSSYSTEESKRSSQIKENFQKSLKGLKGAFYRNNKNDQHLKLHDEKHNKWLKLQDKTGGLADKLKQRPAAESNLAKFMKVVDGGQEETRKKNRLELYKYRQKQLENMVNALDEHMIPISEGKESEKGKETYRQHADPNHEQILKRFDENVKQAKHDLLHGLVTKNKDAIHMLRLKMMFVDRLKNFHLQQVALRRKLGITEEDEVQERKWRRYRMAREHFERIKLHCENQLGMFAGGENAISFKKNDKNNPSLYDKIFVNKATASKLKKTDIGLPPWGYVEELPDSRYHELRRHCWEQLKVAKAKMDYMYDKCLTDKQREDYKKEREIRRGRYMSSKEIQDLKKKEDGKGDYDEDTDSYMDGWTEEEKREERFKRGLDDNIKHGQQKRQEEKEKQKLEQEEAIRKEMKRRPSTHFWMVKDFVSEDENPDTIHGHRDYISESSNSGTDSTNSYDFYNLDHHHQPEDDREYWEYQLKPMEDPELDDLVNKLSLDELREKIQNDEEVCHDRRKQLLSQLQEWHQEYELGEDMEELKELLRIEEEKRLEGEKRLEEQKRLEEEKREKEEEQEKKHMNKHHQHKHDDANPESLWDDGKPYKGHHHHHGEEDDVKDHMKQAKVIKNPIQRIKPEVPDTPNHYTSTEDKVTHIPHSTFRQTIHNPNDVPTKGKSKAKASTHTTHTATGSPPAPPTATNHLFYDEEGEEQTSTVEDPPPPPPPIPVDDPNSKAPIIRGHPQHDVRFNKLVIDELSTHQVNQAAWSAKDEALEKTKEDFIVLHFGGSGREQKEDEWERLFSGNKFATSTDEMFLDWVKNGPTTKPEDVQNQNEVDDLAAFLAGDLNKEKDAIIGQVNQNLTPRARRIQDSRDRVQKGLDHWVNGWLLPMYERDPRYSRGRVTASILHFNPTKTINDRFLNTLDTEKRILNDKVLLNIGKIQETIDIPAGGIRGIKLQYNDGKTHMQCKDYDKFLSNMEEYHRRKNNYKVYHNMKNQGIVGATGESSMQDPSLKNSFFSGREMGMHMLEHINAYGRESGRGSGSFNASSSFSSSLSSYRSNHGEKYEKGLVLTHWEKPLIDGYRSNENDLIRFMSLLTVMSKDSFDPEKDHDRFERSDERAKECSKLLGVAEKKLFQHLDQMNRNILSTKPQSNDGHGYLQLLEKNARSYLTSLPFRSVKI